jgi:hypothetical protein
MLMKYAMVMIAAALLVSLIISCGNRDDRHEIRARYGEPNLIRTRNIDPFWTEVWYYNSLGLAFEFRRTGTCGSDREVYLYYTFEFVPDTTGTNLPQSNTIKPSPRGLWPTAPR